MTKQEELNFANWIAGFTDGEGCFHIAQIKNKKMSLFLRGSAINKKINMIKTFKC